MDGGRKNKHASPEPFADLWKRTAAIDDSIDHISFAEVTRRWRESQAKYVPNWDI
jgi:hypothetical protein